jgi:hypothetical protein
VVLALNVVPDYFDIALGATRRQQYPAHGEVRVSLVDIGDGQNAKHILAASDVKRSFLTSCRANLCEDLLLLL